MGIKDVIARCIERMRGGACATCDNRALCPAGQWQRAFATRPEMKQRGSEVRRLFARAAEAIQSLAPPATRKPCFKKTVEDAIEPMLGTGVVNVEVVARQLGMSRQTLYRRLQDEGATFQELLEARRRQLAIRYLRFDRMSAKVVAYKLGFSDPAAFSRAFKRWTGVSPSQFRTA